MPLFASRNAHFSLDRKPVRTYIRLFLTTGALRFFWEQETRLPRPHGLSIRTDNVMAIEGVPGFAGGSAHRARKGSSR